ncbi:MAG: toll/interleukin-1 receptor domain-containing protein [Oscillospiraceae bacterium]|nr:toll/interleukin-1 receptor domain-containing protein [Oscillospiraceae bacterium]
MTSNPTDVFISYSVKDREVAHTFVAELERHGVSCWIAPRNIPEGAQWAEAIDQAIAQARVFVVIVSESSVASKQVPKEITLAVNHCDCLVPVRIDNADLNGSFRYHLADCQWMDATNRHTEKAAELARTLLAFLGREDATPSEPLPTAAPVRSRPGKKYALLGVLAAAVLLVCAGLFLGRSTAPAASQGIAAPTAEPIAAPSAADTTMTLFLEPLDGTTTKEFYEAEKLITARMDVLFGEDGYELTSSGGQLMAQFSLEQLEDWTPNQVDTLLLSGVTRPLELYFAHVNSLYPGQEAPDPVAISRADIQSVQLLAGPVEGLILEDAPAEYDYLELRFDETTAAELWEVYQLWGEDSALAFDCGHAAYPLGSTQFLLEEEGRVLRWYFSDSDRINQLLLHGLTTPCLPTEFLYSLSAQAIWQPVSSFDAPGEYQRDVSQLEGLCAETVFTTYSEKTYGEWYDFIHWLTGRLDLLQTPYALGTTNFSEQSVALRIETDTLNRQLLELTYNNSVKLRCGPVSLYRTVFGEFELRTAEDGTLSLFVPPAEGSYSAGEFQKLLDHSGKTVSLFVGSVPILRGTVSEAGVTFDVCTFTEDGSVSLLAEELVLLLNENCLPASGFTMLEPTFVLNDLEAFNSEPSCGITYPMLERELDELEARIRKVEGCENAVVTRRMNLEYLYINLNLEENNDLPETAVAAVKQLISELRLEEGTFAQTFFFLLPENTTQRTRIVMTMYSLSNTLEATWIFRGEAIAPYEARLTALLEADPYFSSLAQG